MVVILPIRNCLVYHWLYCRGYYFIMKIYIGYDSRHPIASEVCEYSLRKHSKDLDIEHLKLSEVQNNLYWREYKNKKEIKKQERLNQIK